MTDSIPNLLVKNVMYIQSSGMTAAADASMNMVPRADNSQKT